MRRFSNRIRSHCKKWPHGRGTLFFKVFLFRLKTSKCVRGVTWVVFSTAQMVIFLKLHFIEFASLGKWLMCAGGLRLHLQNHWPITAGSNQPHSGLNYFPPWALFAARTHASERRDSECLRQEGTQTKIAFISPAKINSACVPLCVPNVFVFIRLCLSSQAGQTAWLHTLTDPNTCFSHRAALPHGPHSSLCQHRLVTLGTTTQKIERSVGPGIQLRFIVLKMHWLVSKFEFSDK